MTKKSAKGKQSGAAVEPEVIPPAEAAKRPTVKGYRVSPQAAEFVLAEPIPATEPAGDGDGDEFDEEIIDAEPLPQLSDVEILLNEVGSDERFSLRVDRLTEFDSDGRTDSRAEKQYCGTFAPPTLDYLDRVQRKYGGGAFLFSLYERGVGLRRRWVEHIAQPAEPAQPSAQPFAQPAPPPSGFDSFAQQAKAFGAVVRDLGFVPRSQIVAEAPALPPEPPKSSTDIIRETKELITAVKEITGDTGGAAANPAGEKRGLLDQAGGLIDVVGRNADRFAGAAMRVFGWLQQQQLNAQAQAQAAQRQQQLNGGVQPEGQPLQPLPPPALPAALRRILDTIRDEAINYEVNDPEEEDYEPSEAADVIVSVIKDEGRADPNVGMAIGMLLQLTPLAVVGIIAGRDPLPIPINGLTHVPGYELVGKKRSADVLVREVKYLLSVEAEGDDGGEGEGAEGGGE